MIDAALVSAIEARLHERKGRLVAGEIRYSCTRHEDEHPSARWNSAKATWFCDVCKVGGGALELAKDLGLELPRGNGHGQAERRVATDYVYHDEQASPVYRVLRFDPKGFSQERYEKGEWIGGRGALEGVERFPYKLPEVRSTSGPVLILDGEKDVENSWKLDVPATCCAMGMDKWTDAFSEYLRGRSPVIVADKDGGKGDEQAAHVQKSLKRVLGIDAPIIHMPGEGVKDLSDWIAAGGTREELEKLIGAARSDTSRPPRRRPFADVLAEYRTMPPPLTVTTGIPELDAYLGGGWGAGRLYTILSYTGGYKTRGLSAHYLAAGRSGARAYLISAEMSGYEIASIVGNNAGMAERLDISDEVYTLADVIEEITRWAVEYESMRRVCYVDYQQILGVGDDRDRERNVHSVPQTLRTIAKRLGIAIVANAQANRSSAREGGFPELWHARESGGIEMWSDVVLASQYDRPKLDYICRKNRQGYVGWEISLRVDPERCALRAYAEADAQEDRLRKIQLAVEKRVAEGGPVDRHELAKSIKVGGRVARVYEVGVCVARSGVIEMIGKEVRPKPRQPIEDDPRERAAIQQEARP